MATISFLMFFGFAYYGIKMLHQLRGKNNTNVKSVALARRFLTIAIFFSLSFAGEAALWIVSALTTNFNGRASNIIVGIYLSFDCICIITILYTYWGNVNFYEEEHKRSLAKTSSMIDNNPRVTVYSGRNSVVTRASLPGSTVGGSGSGHSKEEKTPAKGDEKPADANAKSSFDGKASGVGGTSLATTIKSSPLDSSSDVVNHGSIAVNVNDDEPMAFDSRNPEDHKYDD